MNIIITAIYGNYDNPIPQIDQGVDKYILFTDNPNLKDDFWEVIYYPLPFKDNRLNAKYIKIYMWQLLAKDYGLNNTLMWIDACLVLHDNKVFDEFNVGDLVFAMHPVKNRTVSNALEICLTHPKYQDSNWEFIREHSKGLVDYYAACRFLMKPTLETMKFMNVWWAYNQCISRQDQLMLPMTIRDSGVKPTIIPNRVNSYHHNYHL